MLILMLPPLLPPVAIITFLLVIFMDKITRCSRGEESLCFGNLRTASLLFADNVVLLASSDDDLHHAPGQFSAKCKAAEKRVSISQSEAWFTADKHSIAP